jgi:NADPH:quinone reductase-like Zn-dependent oxidoreductase
VQIAKSFGAEVTGVCSTGKVDMVSSLGADHVIDYTKEDFSQNRLQYDLIHAANGYHSISQYKGALKPNGTCIMTGGSLSQLFQAILLGPWFSLVSGKKMGNMLVSPNQDDLTFMSNLIDEGKVTPRIDRRFTLSEVPDAIRYLEEGHATGKVIINM